MGSEHGLFKVLDAELVARWMADLRHAETITHGGASNRHFRQTYDIVTELKRRGGGRPEALRRLLHDADPSLRYTVALQFRSCDPEAFIAAIAALSLEDGEIASRAEAMLAAPPLTIGNNPPPLALDHPAIRMAHLAPPPALTRNDIAVQLASLFPHEIFAALSQLLQRSRYFWIGGLAVRSISSSSRPILLRGAGTAQLWQVSSPAC